MKNKIDNYSFDKTAKTVTFSDYTTIRLDGILLITNVTDNIIIYNFADPLKGGTVTNNVLSLTYDTSSMSNTDKLLIYYDDIIDGKVLQTSTITSTSQGTAIDTQGYGSLVAQISGVWIANITFETSNDGTVWDTCFVLSRDEVSMQDSIEQNGTFSIKRSGRYLRYNCQFGSGSISINIIGRTGEGLSAADMLSFAMDRTHQTPLQVQLPKDLKQDSTGALVFSDMQGPIYWNSQNAASPIVIDCTGYATVIIQKTTTGIVTPTISNDGINFLSTLSIPQGSAASTLATTILTAAGIYTISVTARYLRLVGPASSVQCLIYLSQNAFNINNYVINPAVNIGMVGGTATVTGGLAGTLAIGGNVATGVAPTTNPVQIGGVDDIKGPTAATTSLTRRMLVDSIGRQQIGTQTGQVPGAGSSRALNELGFLADYKNVLTVQDVTRSEGDSQAELLSKILLELQVLNQQIFELPRVLQGGKHSLDEPDDLRNDLTLFDRY